MRVRLITFAVLLAVCAPVGTAHAKDGFVMRKLKGLGRAIGSVIGAPFGGFVEATTAPTLRNVEDTTHRLIRDADGAVARRIAQVEGTAGKLIDTTVTRVDTSLEARILQVKTSVGSTITQVDLAVAQNLDRVDALLAANITRATRAGTLLLDRVDDLAARQLAEVDQILERRIGDARALVQDALKQADDVAKARIAQVDELAGRRLGNLDVIATKQTLSLESTLLRLARLLGIFGFIAFLLWRAFREFITNSNAVDMIREKGVDRGERRTLRRKTGLWALQLLAAGAALAALIAAGNYLPRDAQHRSEAQIETHAAALDAALASYDFEAVRYHASQLDILRPGDRTFAGKARKAEILRDVFGRPARLGDLDGLRQLERDLDAAGRDLPGDPDLLVIECYVTWQVGSTRSDELAAAERCATALRDHPTAPPSAFLLRALAENYVLAFTHQPYRPSPDEQAAYDVVLAMAAELKKRPGTEMPQLQHVLEYNRLVRELDAKVAPAYAAMLVAHGDYVVAAAASAAATATATAADARGRRSTAAGQVVAAWTDFDAQLERSPWLAGDPTSLAAFTLDDATLSQALFFYQDGKKPDKNPRSPPLFFNEPVAPGTPAPKVTPAAARAEAERRAATQPLRIEWSRRYAGMLGKSTLDLLAYEEANRFRALERRARDCVDAYVAFRRGLARPAGVDLARLAGRAATAAAVMGVGSIATTVLGQAPTAAGSSKDLDVARAAVADLNQVRRLHFL